MAGTDDKHSADDERGTQDKEKRFEVQITVVVFQVVQKVCIDGSHPHAIHHHLGKVEPEIGWNKGHVLQVATVEARPCQNRQQRPQQKEEEQVQDGLYGKDLLIDIARGADG